MHIYNIEKMTLEVSENDEELAEHLSIVGRIKDEIQERVSGLMTFAEGISKMPILPIAALKKYIPSAFGAIQKEVDSLNAAEIATHECGHLLVDLFRDKKVSGMFLVTNGPMRESIGMPGGVTTDATPLLAPFGLIFAGKIGQGIIKMGEGKNASVVDLRGKSLRDVMGFVANLLGGEASRIAKNDTEVDIGSAIETMRTGQVISDLAITEASLKHSETYKDISDKLIRQVFKRMIEFFKRPNMRKFVSIISKILADKEYIAAFAKKGLKEKIYGILQKEGVTLEEIKAEESEFQKVLTQCEKETYSLLKASGKAEMTEIPKIAYTDAA